MALAGVMLMASMASSNERVPFLSSEIASVVER